MIKIDHYHYWKKLQCLRLNAGGIKKKRWSKTTCKKVAIRCSNYVKETIIDADLLETYYQ